MYRSMKHFIWVSVISMLITGFTDSMQTFAQGNYGYVTNGYGYNTYRIDVNTNAVSNFVNVNNYAWLPSLNQRGSKLWITSSGQFYVFNTINGATLFTSPYYSSNISRPLFSPDGSRAYMVYGSYPFSIVVRDTGTFARIDSFSITGASSWNSEPVLSLDGTKLYVTDYNYNCYEINTYTGKVLNKLYLSQGYYKLKLHPDGSSLYALSSSDIAVLDLKTFIVTKHLSPLYGSYGIAFNRDGTKLYVCSGNYYTIRVFDISNGTYSDHSLNYYGTDIALAPSDSLLYIVHNNTSNTNNVSIYNTRLDTTTGTLNVPNQPVSIAMPLPRDIVSPAPITDVQITARAYNSARLIFTSTGDDGTSGNARFYSIRYDTLPINDANFSAAKPYSFASAPKPSGSLDTIDVNGLSGSKTYYIGIKVGDEVLNLSSLATASVTLPPPPHISVAPMSFSQTMGDNDSISVSFTVQNTGGSDLSYKVSVLNVSLDEPNAVQSSTLKGTETATQSILGEFHSSAGINAFIEDPAYSSLKIEASTVGNLQRSTINTTGPKVLLLHSDEQFAAFDVKSKLVNIGSFSAVDEINMRFQTPTLETLRSYKAVLVWINYYLSDETTIGNLLADYIDKGGGVVAAMFAMGQNSYHPTPQIQGRFNDQNYWAVQPGFTNQYHDNMVLGTIDKPNHPVMRGVTSFIGNHSYRVQGGTTAQGAQRIASWSDGSVLVAEKSIRGTRRIDLNFFPPSSDVSSGELWESSTDGAKMMANALLYVSQGGGGQLDVTFSPDSGVIQPNGQQDIQMKIKTTSMFAADYILNIDVASNDPDSSSVIVSTHLTVNDLTPPHVVLRFFQNEELPQYLKIISVSRESLFTTTFTVSLGSDTSHPPLIPLDTGKLVQSADYKLRGSGTLTATLVADDSVGNRATVTRQLNALSAIPSNMVTITSVDNFASMNMRDYTLERETYLTCVSERSESSSLASDPVGDSYTFSPMTIQLKKPASITMRYPEFVEPDQVTHLVIGRKLSDGSWQNLPTTLDKQHRTIHTSIDQLGTFQIFYNPAFQSEPVRMIPQSFELSQNFPNPFNPTTTIKYGISEPGIVEVKILNVLGQDVRTLINEYQESGYYELRWDGRSGQGTVVSSGMYFYQLKAGSTVLHKKMSFIK